jgi:LysM repeat protein
VLLPSESTLSCDPVPSATGFLQEVAGAACALVHRGVVQKITKQQHSHQLCSQIYGGPQYAHITGTVSGEPVNLMVTRTDGCGTAAWQTLEPLLGDPERQSVPKAHAAPVTAATTTTAPPRSYQAKRGDTLTSIAKQFGVPISAILTINHLADPDHLVEGQSLLIPPVPPKRLEITPLAAQAGATFTFTLTGAWPSENVTFEIDGPNTKSTGPPHAASADGTVTATYATSGGDTPGVYTVVANGDEGTTTRASFQVNPGSAAPIVTSP